MTDQNYEAQDGTTQDKKLESLNISLRGWEECRDLANAHINEIQDKIKRVENGEGFIDDEDGPVKQPEPETKYTAPELMSDPDSFF